VYAHVKKNTSVTHFNVGDGVSESEVNPRCRTVSNIRVANIWRTVLLVHFLLLCDLAAGLLKPLLSEVGFISRHQVNRNQPCRLSARDTIHHLTATPQSMVSGWRATLFYIGSEWLRSPQLYSTSPLYVVWEQRRYPKCESSNSLLSLRAHSLTVVWE
jgi:hypothetical protein